MKNVGAKGNKIVCRLGSIGNNRASNLAQLQHSLLDRCVHNIYSLAQKCAYSQ